MRNRRAVFYRRRKTRGHDGPARGAVKLGVTTAFNKHRIHDNTSFGNAHIMRDKPLLTTTARVQRIHRFDDVARGGDNIGRGVVLGGL